jgi:hypothetical protein
MGWDHVHGWTPKDVVADRLKPWPKYKLDSSPAEMSGKVLAHHFHGRPGCNGVLYLVRELTTHHPDGTETSERYIEINLVEGGGHKALEESMHPYYYDCPLAFFDLVPERCAEWRQKVREHAQTKGP